jgi:hypothetical protein
MMARVIGLDELLKMVRLEAGSVLERMRFG